LGGIEQGTDVNHVIIKERDDNYIMKSVDVIVGKLQTLRGNWECVDRKV